MIVATIGLLLHKLGFTFLVPLFVLHLRYIFQEEVSNVHTYLIRFICPSTNDAKYDNFVDAFVIDNPSNDLIKANTKLFKKVVVNVP